MKKKKAKNVKSRSDIMPLGSRVLIRPFRKEELQKKKAEAERNFRQNVDQIRKEGGKVEKPVREIDLD